MKTSLNQNKGLETIPNTRNNLKMPGIKTTLKTTKTVDLKTGNLNEANLKSSKF